MFRIKQLTAAVAVATVAVPAGLAGQQPASTDSLAKAERSWAIQARLAYIEQNKAAFVKQMLESWVPYVDQSAYDPYAELYDVAMRAPAWQVYGASLAGRYNTMVDVLRGHASAAQFINTLDAPQAKAFASPLSNLGETTSQLVFTPIPPCRMVDTRGSGAKTGILAANTSRTFDLTTDGYTEGQGGQTSGCTGLPSISHYGWALNITVADYTANGGLQVYPFFGEVPATSIINYFPGAYALANNGTVTGCYLCSDDITVRAFGSATHVIIDVMGYFQAAPVVNAATTIVAGTLVAVPASSQAFVSGGACPAGTTLIGGELDFSTGSNVLVGEMARSSSTVMRFWAVNQDGSSRNAVAYSTCQETPLRQ